MSEQKHKHRSNSNIEPEAVFDQLKSNNKFNRFSFIGLEKVEMEFLLIAIGNDFRKMVAKTIFLLNHQSLTYLLETKLRLIDQVLNWNSKKTKKRQSTTVSGDYSLRIAA
ncbi:transposase [Belliella sp. DSM 111904]|uniref:Transposase n=1 Tax=Belliella filtrata TaxID=2923435 RepID=A0ABS9V1H6_9BACT|nr:transposase [Belliella filtrata]MCH7410064.1 transposase [Belliella filtrata]